MSAFCQPSNGESGIFINGVVRNDTKRLMALMQVRIFPSLMTKVSVTCGSRVIVPSGPCLTCALD